MPHPKPVDSPSKEQIAARSAEIRAGWSASRELSRRRLPQDGPVQIPFTKTEDLTGNKELDL